MPMEVNSLYLHFPYCKHLCNYCDFFKHKLQDQSQLNNFHRYLENSAEKLWQLLYEKGASLSVLETLYLGGGTPSLWGEAGAKFLEKFMLDRKISFKPKHEFTLETDPGAWETVGLELFKQLGVNRFSIGLQSLDALIFPYLDRSHTLKESLELLEFMASHQNNFSVDFMLGVPHPEFIQRDIEGELERILSFSPKHISLYIFSVSNKYPLFSLIPEESQIAEEFERVHQFLTSKGFNHYEVSNYALSGFESKHNWKYWDQKSYAALGPSAAGLLVKENEGLRFKWKPQLVSEFDVEELSSTQLLYEKLYTSSRSNKGFILSEFFDGENLLQAMTVAKKYQEQGLGIFSKDNFTFNSQGMIVLDSLVQNFVNLI